MNEVVSLRGEDVAWAVVASLGRVSRVASIYPNRDKALEDQSWREQHVFGGEGHHI